MSTKYIVKKDLVIVEAESMTIYQAGDIKSLYEVNPLFIKDLITCRCIEPYVVESEALDLSDDNVVSDKQVWNEQPAA